MAKQKKLKLDFRILSDVKCICGCNRYIKQNVIDRNPTARNCYLSHLLAHGKTQIFAGASTDIRTGIRTPRYINIRETLNHIKRKQLV